MDAAGVDAAGEGATRTLNARHMIAAQARASQRLQRPLEFVQSVVWLLSPGSPTMTLDTRAGWCGWSELRLGWLSDELQVSAAIDVSRAEERKAR